MAEQARRLAQVEAFQNLSPAELDELESRLTVLTVARGALLIRQGDEADALYLVVSGRFQVLLEGVSGPIAEIGAGTPIGEIAFFAGGRRTASVKADRDSLVLRLTREDFEHLAERSPRIWSTITSTLARRLAATTIGQAAGRAARPKTIAVCRAGASDVPAPALEQIKAVFVARARSIVLDEAAALSALGSGAEGALDSQAATGWFNDLEGSYDFVVYVADRDLTPWSEKAIRQADLVLLVADSASGIMASDRTLNPLEEFAQRLHKPDNLRLVLVHPIGGRASGTRAWLTPRPWLHMHHHVARDERADYERLYRFINGTALGLVACGGGAFCSAHIGLFQALDEAGLAFDILGGTSGGAAMTAALALGVSPDEIERRTHDIFVTRKALRRWTWPRYSLLDHSVFDDALAEHYTSGDIEDLWLPFFAVATNLSRNALQLIRRGPLWEAVRASAAIPALLPPVFTGDGEMLVDGCLLDNVPVQAMRQLKTGPNVVIEFRAPPPERFDVDHRALPGRKNLLRHSLTHSARERLPPAPSPQSVLMRSLMLSRRNYLSDVEPDDLVLLTPIPDGVGHLDWHRHAELRQVAYRFASAELARLAAEGKPLLAGMATRPAKAAE